MTFQNAMATFPLNGFIIFHYLQQVTYVRKMFHTKIYRKMHLFYYNELMEHMVLFIMNIYLIVNLFSKSVQSKDSTGTVLKQMMQGGQIMQGETLK